MTNCLVSRSWVAEGLSAVGLCLSLSPCAPVNGSVVNDDGGLWSASGTACAWIVVYEN